MADLTTPAGDPAAASAAPTVTIGLPVYNGQRFLERSVRSVLEQDYTDFELLVSDNGSTDGSMDLVEKIANGDPRVVILRNDTNQGAAWNYNNALAHARGKYFRWHADDDWFEPTLIGALVAELDADSQAVLAHSWTRFVNDEGETTRAYEDDLGADSEKPDVRLREVVNRLTYCNPVFGLIRTEPLRSTAQIASFPGSDTTLLYELAMHGRFAIVPELLYNRRPGNSIKSNNTMKAVAEWFSPTGSGGRFPALAQFTETVRALKRAPLSNQERLRCAAVFLRYWPIDYARKSRRRARRRQQRTS